MSDEHPNCQAIDRFLNAIPAIRRPICSTQNVDEKPVANGFTAAWHNAGTDSGFTVIAMNDGDMLLSIETNPDEHPEVLVPNNYEFKLGRNGKRATKMMHGSIADAEAFAGEVNRIFFA